MALIVIGGHSRSVGKTSVVAGLIAALPEFHWTAIKITQYGHGICSANGELCDCATDDHSWAVTEERNRSGDSDTSDLSFTGRPSRSRNTGTAFVPPTANSATAPPTTTVGP